MEITHFETGLRLWEEIVKSLFQGKKANVAVARSKQIAALMQFKIKGSME